MDQENIPIEQFAKILISAPGHIEYHHPLFKALSPRTLARLKKITPDSKGQLSSLRRQYKKAYFADCQESVDFNDPASYADNILSPYLVACQRVGLLSVLSVVAYMNIQEDPLDDILSIVAGLDYGSDMRETSEGGKELVIEQKVTSALFTSLFTVNPVGVALRSIEQALDLESNQACVEMLATFYELDESSKESVRHRLSRYHNSGQISLYAPHLLEDLLVLALHIDNEISRLRNAALALAAVYLQQVLYQQDAPLVGSLQVLKQRYPKMMPVAHEAATAFLAAYQVRQASST